MTAALLAQIRVFVRREIRAGRARDVAREGESLERAARRADAALKRAGLKAIAGKPPQVH